MPTKKTERTFPPSVQVYFTGNNKSLHKKIQALAKKHGMSESAISVLAIRLGLPMVRKNLEGLLIDIDAQAENHEQSKGLYLSH